MTTNSVSGNSRVKEDLRQTELEYRLNQQQLLSEFGLFALGCHELDGLLQQACELAAVGMRTRFAKVLRYRPEDDDLLVCAGVGWRAGVVGHATIGADLASPAGYALKTGNPVISNHLSQEQRFRTPKLLAEHGIKRAINVLVAADGWRGVLEVDSTDAGKFGEADLAFLQGFAHLSGVAAERQKAEAALREESRTLATLNRIGASLASELDLERVVQMVTDAAVELTGAQFGAYFHNVMNETGEHLSLYTLSGAPREAFERFGKPRPTAIFGPTFRNEGVVRSDDILVDPRYGKNKPHRGMPEGHLPVRSYMAVPVVSRAGEVLGGLIFGHSEPARFSGRHEKLIVGVAAQAAIAIDNARLYQGAQHEIDERREAEKRLRESEERYRTLFEAIDAGFCIVEVQFNEDGRPVDYCFIEVNPAFEKQTGLANAAGKRMRELAPGHEQHWFDTYGHVALSGEPLRFENEASALSRWYDVHAFRVGDPQAHRVAILFNDISDRKHLEVLLRERVAHQDVLIREVSHRVKNSLAIVSSLLGLQARGSKDRDVRRAIEDAEARVGTIAQVHDQLWRQVPGEDINLDTFLGDLCAKLGETAPDHAIIYTGEQVMVPADQAVPLGLLVNELVTNAIKYAYPGERVGEVRVELRSSPESGTCLEIADRGVGLPNDFDLARSTGSLGVRIINGMVRQLGAKIRTELVNPGTRFVIELLGRSPDHLKVP